MSDILPSPDQDSPLKQKLGTIHGEIDLDIWQDIYKLPRICRVDNVIKDFQYKILHNLCTVFMSVKLSGTLGMMCLSLGMSIAVVISLHLYSWHF